jgi:uncharacterized membrane protein YphA (DoxX/SURF4 family)
MIPGNFFKITRRSGWVALLSGSLLVVPSFAYAHVNWFVSADAAPAESVSAYSFAEPAVWVVIAGMLLLLVKAALLEWKTQDILHRKKIEEKLKQWRPQGLRIFQIFLGLSLLGCAVEEVFLAPHFMLEGGPGSALVVGLEGMVGLLMILNLSVPFASALLLFLFGILIAQWGLWNALDYINIAGMAIFLGLMRVSVVSPLQRYREWAVPILRVSTGAALIILAFSEKLLNPDRGVALLQEYPMNFMPLLGFSEFSDRLFILAAGATETVFGLIFLLGWIPRLNTAALAAFLVASNISFFALGFPEEGFQELIGHLPVLGTALIVLTYGAGDKMKLHLSAGRKK